MPVLEMPWNERFDAAILYDAMHDFDDEVETHRVIRRTPVPEGRIVIHEGVRPSEGLEGERQLISEMQEYGTLESPFDPDYLVTVLGKAGFTQVTRFAAIDELLDLSDRTRELQRIEGRMENPPMNTAIALNPVPGEIPVDAPDFLGTLEATGSWHERQDGRELALPITVTNARRGFLAGGNQPVFPSWDSHARAVPACGGRRASRAPACAVASLDLTRRVGGRRSPDLGRERRRSTRGRGRSRSRRHRLVCRLRLVTAGRSSSERA
jgi:hypothetical protein